MRQYGIKITALAEQDLECISDYIAYKLRNPDAAVNTVRGIRNKINSLQNFPYRNDFDSDSFLSDVGVRIDYYRNYKIYYVIDDREYIVYIIRILHTLEDSGKSIRQTLGIV